MKAMKKMPDKLYGWTGVLGSLYASPRKPEEVNSEEYIRKDSLLERIEALKAQSWGLREKGYGDVFYGAQIAILEEIIDKIKSM